MARMTTARKLLLGLLGGGGAAFSPLTIPGLAVWLDASDASTLFQASNGTTPATADGDVVGYWGDKSSNGRHPIQATTANKPLLKLATQNGRNVVRFDGIDDYLQVAFAALPQPNTVFLVLKSSGAAFRRFTDGTAAGDRCVIFYDTGPGALAMFSGTTVSVPAVSVANCSLLTVLFSGANSTTRANGILAASGNTGTNSLGGLTLAIDYNLVSYPANVDFSELIIVNGAITDANRNAVEQYLVSKWGIV
jgi:hypothetical protein